MKWPKSVKMYTDGACRGNPGPASVGVSFTNMEDEEFETLSETIGETTNNFAEYMALIKGLEKAIQEKVDNIWALTDSEFMVKQIKGEYKVKAEHIKDLHAQAVELFSKFKKKKLEHVRREKNKRADELANQALDRSGPTKSTKKPTNPFDDEF